MLIHFYTMYERRQDGTAWVYHFIKDSDTGEFQIFEAPRHPKDLYTFHPDLKLYKDIMKPVTPKFSSWEEMLQYPIRHFGILRGTSPTNQFLQDTVEDWIYNTFSDTDPNTGKPINPDRTASYGFSGLADELLTNPDLLIGFPKGFGGGDMCAVYNIKTKELFYYSWHPNYAEPGETDSKKMVLKTTNYREICDKEAALWPPGRQEEGYKRAKQTIESALKDLREELGNVIGRLPKDDVYVDKSTPEEQRAALKANHDRAVATVKKLLSRPDANQFVPALANAINQLDNVPVPKSKFAKGVSFDSNRLMDYFKDKDLAEQQAASADGRASTIVGIINKLATDDDKDDDE